MKYLIMMTQSPDDQVSPAQEWTPDEVKASWAHMLQIHQELAEAGELQTHRGPPDHGRATAGAVSARGELEDLLRDLAPQVLGVLVRRHGDFADAEDAVQEALLAAASQWPAQGVPGNPRGWLITAEIAATFLVPEDTMAKHISRAKRRIKTSDVPFRMPTADE